MCTNKLSLTLIFLIFSIISTSCGQGGENLPSNTFAPSKNSSPFRTSNLSKNSPSDKAKDCFVFIENQLKDFPSYINEYKSISKKIGGVSAKGALTGVYEIDTNGKKRRLLFKQGRDDGENIAEFIAAIFYSCFLQGYGAGVILAKYDSSIDTKTNVKDDLHNNIYVGSSFFDDFKEVFKIMGLSKRPGRIHTKGTSFKNFVQNNKNTNLGEVIAISLWLGDYDTHSANLGTALVDHEKVFVKIDHGWSFAFLQDNMNYKKTPWSKLSLDKPANNFSDYDKDNFLNDSSGTFRLKIHDLKSIDKEYIRIILVEAFKKLEKVYNPSAYQSFAKWINYPNPKKEIISLELIINYLTDKLYNRAQNGLK
ncbi:hypothetical protein [Fluviispira multicolorata]|uniref:LepB N-terminal domain-containing protein n=1 Tax=Fluviispira multicolorata TaxID=2654512 RepID=A0A833N6F5_9BACT|nr:hypothetical protein [Fluviispira multicolorata]KAB8029958.1 hypothetical protein GCL57_10505 [Fluviispira multicolorata]